MAEISNGLLKQKVDITINKLVFDYDVVLIIGPTFPHEVVGFSGGNKYLFPGIAGQGDGPVGTGRSRYNAQERR